DHRGAHTASPWTTDGGVGWRAYRAGRCVTPQGDATGAGRAVRGVRGGRGGAKRDDVGGQTRCGGRPDRGRLPPTAGTTTREGMVDMRRAPRTPDRDARGGAR